MAISAADAEGARVLPRTLAGATVMQIVPSLADEPLVRETLGIAHALVHAGTRAIVAEMRPIWSRGRGSSTLCWLGRENLNS